MGSPFGFPFGIPNYGGGPVIGKGPIFFGGGGHLGLGLFGVQEVTDGVALFGGPIFGGDHLGEELFGGRMGGSGGHGGGRVIGGVTFWGGVPLLGGGYLWLGLCGGPMGGSGGRGGGVIIGEGSHYWGGPILRIPLLGGVSISK